MDIQEVRHICENQRYRIVIERAAVKGIDGFKVEANGDEIIFCEQDAHKLYDFAKQETEVKIAAPIKEAQD